MDLLRKKRSIFILLTLISLVTVSVIASLSVSAQEDAITIRVDASQELNVISPYVYGLNHGPWAEMPLDMADEAIDLGFTFSRWPGGNWGDEFNITELQMRIYMGQSAAWGAVPSIHVRLYGGTPEQAAELVRYANVENDYNVQYWYIGNEPNLYEDYTLEQFLVDWREFALAMLEVDPDIILIGPEVSQFPDTTSPSDYNAQLNDEWLREFLIANGDLVDVIGVHRYPFPLGQAVTTIPQMRENVPRWATVVQNMRDTMNDVLDEPLPLAITEVNSHWSHAANGEASPDSYYNAVWWSGVLTTLIHEEVDIITYFLLYSTGTLGEYGLIDRYELRPTYYTYVLFAELGETRLQSETSDQYVTAIAANREDGARTLIVTNLYQEEITVTLDLTGFDDMSVSDMKLLSPDIMAESVSVGDYLDGETLTIPEQSVVLLVFE